MTHTFSVLIEQPIIHAPMLHKTLLQVIAMCETNFKVVDKRWRYTKDEFDKSNNIDNEIADALQCGATAFEITISA